MVAFVVRAGLVAVMTLAWAAVARAQSTLRAGGVYRARGDEHAAGAAERREHPGDPLVDLDAQDPQTRDQVAIGCHHVDEALGVARALADNRKSVV